MLTVKPGRGAVATDNHFGDHRRWEETVLDDAGAVVTPRTVIPPRVLAVGSPARVLRDLKDTELEMVRKSAGHYVQLARIYLAESAPRTATHEGDGPL